MEKKLLEKQLKEEKEIIDEKQHSKAIKILIIIAKILLLFVMPILVGILDHFVFQ